MSKSLKPAIILTRRILDAWLPSKIRYDQIPGLAVGIVYQGKLVYKRGFGWADIAQKKPITAQTCFRIASISKTFTAVAIMQLVERKKIGLDDKVVDYVPWFRVRFKDKESRVITIRQLLSHTAGVFRDGDTGHWANGKFPTAVELRKSISRKTVVFENATKFKYSNFGYAILGEVIQKVSGLSYSAYCRRHIFRPLELQRTAVDFDSTTESWLAQGYSRPIPDEARYAFTHAATNSYAAATGFLSNIHDLARYISALSLGNKTTALIGREAKKEMMRPHWETGEESESWGLGLDIYKINNRKIVGHGGGFPGFLTMIALDPENDVGVITLSNANDVPIGTINRAVFETLYKAHDGAINFKANTHASEKYEGIYRSPWDDAIIVALDKTLLAFDPKTTSPLKHGVIFKPQGRNKFLIETPSNFDSPGEEATFIFRAGKKKAQRLLWGATPMERLKEK